MKSEPHSMPVENMMALRLNNLLAAQKNLANAAQLLADQWSVDEATRNRPKRQQLTTDLMSILPKPLAFGSIVDKIARECNVELP